MFTYAEYGLISDTETKMEFCGFLHHRLIEYSFPLLINNEKDYKKLQKQTRVHLN